MPTPCGIFWDIQNIDVPKGATAYSVDDRIKKNIISKYDLTIEDFYIVGAYNTLTRDIVAQLSSIGEFAEAQPGRNVADNMLKRRMEKFVNTYGNGSTLILLTGDGGFGVTLKSFRENYRITIYFIRSEECFSEKLTSLADRIFLLKRDTLDLIYEKTPGNGQNCNQWFPGIQSKTFVKIACDILLPTSILSSIQNDLAFYGGSYAIFIKHNVWCLFDERDDAERALALKGSYVYKPGQFISVSYQLDTYIEAPPQEVINLIVAAKLSKPNLIRDQSTSLTMYKYKVETSDFTETLDDDDDSLDFVEHSNAVKNLYSLFTSTRSTNSNQSTNFRSNNGGCAQS